jgi:glycosyltransferase involved in cell wall biosynthesis
MTLSVCIIAKNETENLDTLLPMLGFADEVVVVDTGAMPDTMITLCGLDPIKHEPGIPWEMEGRYRNSPWIKFSHFPWTDSFAAARNFALSKCTGDYVLWLDADDRVPEESARLIRAALDNPGPRTQAKTVHFGFVLRDHGPQGLNFAEGQPRLFPRVEGLTWEGRVHESYITSAAALGIEKVDCDNIVIDHTGYQDPDLMLKKHARNLRLMKMEVDSPKKFYHMAKNLQGLGHFIEAEECYRRVLEGEWAEPLEKVFRDQVRTCMASLIMTVSEADESVDESVDQYLEGNNKPDALFLRAEVALKRGQVFEAEAMYKEYASYEHIKDPHGTNQGMLQAAARDRLDLIQKTREKVYAG